MKVFSPQSFLILKKSVSEDEPNENVESDIVKALNDLSATSETLSSTEEPQNEEDAVTEDTAPTAPLYDLTADESNR